MAKDTKDMSLSEIEIELIRLRNIESKTKILQKMVNDFVALSENQLGKISKIFTETSESKNLDLNIEEEKEISKTQKIKNSIIDLLSKEELETSQILIKLIESGLLMPVGTKQGKLDYNNLRSCLAVLKNNEIIYKNKEERKEPWRLRERKII
jgi:hypothetical protein